MRAFEGLRFEKNQEVLEGTPQDVDERKTEPVDWLTGSFTELLGRLYVQGGYSGEGRI